MWPHVYVICVCLVILSVGEKKKIYIYILDINILELRVQRILACLRYNGALDRSLVPTMGALDLKIVDSKGDVVTFMMVFVVKRDSA